MSFWLSLMTIHRLWPWVTFDELMAMPAGLVRDLALLVDGLETDEGV